MPAIVNREMCNSCEECVETCPTEAIVMVDGKAKVDPDECTDCYACVDACPEEAIEMDD